MRAKTIALPRQIPMGALLLGLAIGVAGAGLAHSATLPAQPSQAAAAPAVHQQLAWAPDYTCQAKPGDWCDLRDWRGFGQPEVAAQPEPAPAR